MDTLEEYISQYRSNMKYMDETRDGVFDEIIRVVGHSKFYCSPSRYDETLWILEVFTNEEPSTMLPIVRRCDFFADYHIDEKYVNCLRITLDPFSKLRREDLDGCIKQDCPINTE